MPERLTPHSLRRTFASVLYALGRTPPEVMAQLGHTDPKLALRIYARSTRRDEGENERLRALVGEAEQSVTVSEGQNVLSGPVVGTPTFGSRMPAEGA